MSYEYFFQIRFFSKRRKYKELNFKMRKIETGSVRRPDLTLIQNICENEISVELHFKFINILHTNFSNERHFGSFLYVHVTRENLPKRCSYKKRIHITLMKLTPAFQVESICYLKSAKFQPSNLIVQTFGCFLCMSQN